VLPCALEQLERCQEEGIDGLVKTITVMSDEDSGVELLRTVCALLHFAAVLLGGP